MRVDHIFIFSGDEGVVANLLVEFGLSEGSNRIHKGQGTTNRKFYFHNFFLEILWVHNVQEIKSELTGPSGLWERSEFSDNGFSRFGLCLVNAEETDLLFRNAFAYRPKFLPDPLQIDVLNNDHQSTLPWTFRLPFKGNSDFTSEPLIHKQNVKKLTRACFEYSGVVKDGFLKYFKEPGQAQFKKTHRNWLTLTFDEERQGKNVDFDSLNLTIKY